MAFFIGLCYNVSEYIMGDLFMEMKKTDINLVPDTANLTPDYYCTWQTQLYTSCDGKPPKQRREIVESSLFGNEKPYGWAHFYPDARRDLFIVMDDSWDVPLDGNGDLYGSLILSPERFPEATSGDVSNAEALKNLTDRIKSLGWKGLGGWVCCQESKAMFHDMTREEYWETRLKDADESGFSYWKVDWGAMGYSEDFRRMLTDMGHKLAPNLVIEHAMVKDIIAHSDTFRTYDVPGIMSIPMTMHKLYELAGIKKTENGYKGLINCEDEVYIGAAGGYAFGVMRHPNAGSFTDGRPDPSFPALHRNIKTKITEITRAARWHRIAPAFGADGTPVNVDENKLADSWLFIDREAEMEGWWYNEDQLKDNFEGDLLTKTATARISRGCSLPEVMPDTNGNVPFIVAAKNPTGAFSIVTAGRTMGRDYFIPKCDISAEIGNCDTIGVFGEYGMLTLSTSFDKICRVLMQDLADDCAYDITELVSFSAGKVTLPGELIHDIGTTAQPEDDTSEPGVVIRIE